MAEEDQPLRRSCGTMEVHDRLLRTVEGYAEARAASENQALRALMSPLVGRTGCTEIPTVVHVVYKTNAQNISDAQVTSQIDVLNADFRKKNADVSSAPPPFVPLASDARIQFALATTDPSGKPTNGITRTKTTKDEFLQNDGVKKSATGGQNAWPADKYLNIWVCQLGNNLLGYAQFPGGPAATDGVVTLHSGFGTTGTATAPFNLGRTTTHEVGHWLNLRHIWGDDGTGCSGDDFVGDTPNQGGPNYGSPAFPTVSCGNAPSGDMFMNYMDYVDDAAMVMFSAGQVTRMQATLDGLRSSIGKTIPCGPKIPVKDLGKDPIKDFPKDLPHKEFVKEPPKDFAKDPPKDFAKDPPKDLPKDPPHKEPLKDPPHKEFIFDPGPKIFDPQPKIRDPQPKFFDPQPKIFDPQPKVRDPQPKLFDPPPKGFDPPIGPGGIPYVLATPGGGGGPDFQQFGAALSNAYQTLLAHYAGLHERGLLDEAAFGAWTQAAAAHQELVRSMGG